MQSPHLDTSFQEHIFGSTPSFDAGINKLHHAGYIGDLDASYSTNYATPGIHTVHGYSSLDHQAYTDAYALFPSTAGMLTNAGRQMELADYTSPITRAKQQDNFRTPLDSLALAVSPDAYITNVHDDHSNHDYHLQQTYQHPFLTHHNQYQNSYYLPSSSMMAAKIVKDNAAILCPSSIKMECNKLETYEPNRHVDKTECNHLELYQPNRHAEKPQISSTAASTSINFSGVQEDKSASNLHITSSSSDLVISAVSPPESKSGNNFSTHSIQLSPLKTTTNDTRDEESISESKPTMSYIALIGKAILESEQRRLNLGAIYGWIEKHYPFYKQKGQGWRNSVRHNLSLNDCFIKAGRCEDGKGNYWAIHPGNIQDFIRGDFRQRRRSRRRGRKKESDINMYHVSNGYLPSPSMHLPSGISLNPTALSSIYSPYSEAERRAYRLDEAIFRQRMSNPFVKWYQPGVTSPGYVSTSPPVCTTAVYPSSTSTQWSQACTDSGSSQGFYPGQSTTLPR